MIECRDNRARPEHLDDERVIVEGAVMATALQTLHIRLLGTFSLTYGDALVAGVNTPRLQSLLAYLVLHRDTPQLRQHLAFQFWPNATEGQARNNLRQALHSLRLALPDP